MMLPPEVIDRLRQEREEMERPALELPLYLPEIMNESSISEDAEACEYRSNVIVIDLA